MSSPCYQFIFTLARLVPHVYTNSAYSCEKCAFGVLQSLICYTYLRVFVSVICEGMICV